MLDAAKARTMGQRDTLRECGSCRGWGAIFWRCVNRGCDRADAAFRADRIIARRHAAALREEAGK